MRTGGRRLDRAPYTWEHSLAWIATGWGDSIVRCTWGNGLARRTRSLGTWAAFGALGDAFLHAGEDDFNDIIINIIIIEKQNTKHRIIHRITKDASNNKKYIELEVQTISYRPINGANEQEKDTNIKWIIEVMKQTKSTTSPLQVKPNNREQRIYIKEFENLFLDKQTLWRRNNDIIGNQLTQFVAPKHQRNQIMQKFHDSLLAGHLMFEKTLIRIRNRFFWPEMFTSITVSRYYSIQK